MGTFMDTVLPNIPIIGDLVSGGEDYFMADVRAGRDKKNAATQAQGLVGKGYDNALGINQNLAGIGFGDYGNYRDMVQSGFFNTDPRQFQTGQYSPGNYGQNAPRFNQYQQGQSPGYQGYQRGKAPTFNAYQAGKAPTFNAYQAGQGPAYQDFKRGSDPVFEEFRREKGPEFERADAGQFNFNYQQSPDYQFTRDEGIKSIEGRASQQGRRLAGGTDKEIMQFASGLASQDYGNQYNRARGSFENDRGFRADQSSQANNFNQGGYQFSQNLDAQQQNLSNQFSQGNYQYGTGVDSQQNAMRNQYGQNAFEFNANMGMNQSNQANQYGQNAYQFNANMGAGQSDLENAYNQNNYQYGNNFDANQMNQMNNYNQNDYQFNANMGNQNNMWAQNMNNQNYWQGQGMNQDERQFGFNAGLTSNNQNYNMYSNNNKFLSGLYGGLSDVGYDSQVNLGNMYINQGESMANAALGVGNAKADSRYAVRNTVNSTLNDVGQIAGAYKAIAG